jgi:hypothetical protein
VALADATGEAKERKTVAAKVNKTALESKLVQSFLSIDFSFFCELKVWARSIF